MKKNKKNKEGRIKKFKKIFNKKILIILVLVILLVICLLVIIKDKKPEATGNAAANTGAQVQITPLSSEQINMLAQTVLSSEFIKDLPSNGAIALQFYDFPNGERVWQSGFLIGKDGFLTEGTPDIVLIMHSKYISQLDGTNLCDIIKAAQTNGDMWVETEQSEAKLLLKYAGMMKYRDCFGF